MPPKLKTYFLILILAELLFAYAPAFAQSAQVTTTPYDYSQNGTNPISSQIESYLCNPKAGGSGVLYQCINQIYKFAIVLASVIGVFFIVIAGYIYMSAEGSGESVDKAKSILESTIVSLVILLGGFVFLNTINPDLVQFHGNTLQPVNLTVPPSTPAVTPTTSTPNTSCTQNFSVSAATGCVVGSTCVNVTSYTPHTDSSDCATNNGVCLMSPSAASKVQTFLSAFNSIAQGTCSAQIASAIQVINAPSISDCHSPSYSSAGTCADFHLIPYNTACKQDFYQAAQQSGAVRSFLDEYCSPVNSTTGGNIHVNF